MDIIRALEALKRVELKLQELYAFYNRTFAADKEVAGVFFELSLDEKSHAELIDYQLRTIKKNRAMCNDVDFDIGPLDRFVADVEARMSSKGPVLLEDAVRFGIELEKNSIEFEYKALMRESNPELGELVSRLGTSDRDHIDRLMALAKKNSLF